MYYEAVIQSVKRQPECAATAESIRRELCYAFSVNTIHGSHSDFNRMKTASRILYGGNLMDS